MGGGQLLVGKAFVLLGNSDREDSRDAGWLLLAGSDIMPLFSPLRLITAERVKDVV